MSILVTGAAGYIGSITVERLIKEGYTVVALDNLKQGHLDVIVPEAIFVQADLNNMAQLDKVFRCHRIDAVIHLAAESLVEYSIADPQRYFHANVINGIHLIDTMIKYDVTKLVFSSTAAVYGEPNSLPIMESAQPIPMNAYGESKLMFECILKWYGRAYGLKHISLRYFNAAGASQHLGEDHHPETHLIPNVLRAALENSGPVTIFGADYPTKDGSCIRDYIHVVDIACAHILALEKIEGLSDWVYNLGSGIGYSVFEVVAVARKVTEAEIPITITQRRPADPAVLVASSERARIELGWQPKFPDLEEIIESAWWWLKEHPKRCSK